MEVKPKLAFAADVIPQTLVPFLEEPITRIGVGNARQAGFHISLAADKVMVVNCNKEN